MDRVPSDVIYGLTLDGRGHAAAGGRKRDPGSPARLAASGLRQPGGRALAAADPLLGRRRAKPLGQSNRPKLVRMGRRCC